MKKIIQIQGLRNPATRLLLESGLCLLEDSASPGMGRGQRAVSLEGTRLALLLPKWALSWARPGKPVGRLGHLFLSFHRLVGETSVHPRPVCQVAARRPGGMSEGRLGLGPEFYDAWLFKAGLALIEIPTLLLTYCKTLHKFLSFF